MLIADAQAHVWARSTPERPSHPPDPPHRDIQFGPDELLREMESAGVTRALLTPPHWDHYRPDIALEAARQHPDRFAVTGRLDIEAPDAGGVIAAWRRDSSVLAMRCSFTRPQHSSTLREKPLDWLWDAAERAGLPLMVNVPHMSLHIVDAVAVRHPALKLTIDHLGIPKGTRNDDAFRDLDRLLALARRPNISVKASAMPDFTDETYPYRGLHPHLRRIYDAFGPKRIFWASDLSRLRCSNYAQMVTMITEEIPWLSPTDKEWIMGRGVCEWLGWKLPKD